jgi:predicted nucleotidyltransferase
MKTGAAIDVKPEQLALLKTLLNREVPAKTVWAYGSRVNGTAGPASDLDLVVFDPDTDSLANLREALSESDLPFTVDVMDWNMIPERFQKNIRKNYLVLQELPEYNREENRP